MVSPTRYTRDMFDEHFSNGVWTEDTTWKLWQRNAKLYPDKIAFVDFEKRLTWKQVRIMSDSIALNLLELGLKKDELIPMGQQLAKVDYLRALERHKNSPSAK